MNKDRLKEGNLYSSSHLASVCNGCLQGIDSCLCFLTDQIQQSPRDETKEDEERQASKDQIKIRQVHQQ